MKTVQMEYVIPYIQYGLMVKSRSTGEVYKAIGYFGTNLILEDIKQPADISDLILLLEPISKIKETVNLNGENIQPWRYLDGNYKTDFNIGTCFLQEKLPVEYDDASYLEHNHFDSWILIQRCFEMQIDIYGLIADGHALDIEKATIYN